MREQIRLWFYSQLFMSVVLVGRAPFREVLGYEKMLDENGREMHGSWGNMIEAEDAFAQMGADVMRWQYCAQPPDRNLLFGFGPAREIKRKLLTLWHSTKFLVDYGNIEGFTPTYADLEQGPQVELEALDRWLVARTAQLVREAHAAYEEQLTFRAVQAFEAYLDDLSNWYIRRSRRRFYGLDEAAFRTLWYGLVQSLRVVAPLMPFLTDHLWRNLVAGACEGAPDSVHLAGWPAVEEPDEELLAEMAQARLVAELGRRARDASGLKLRQPVRRLVVEGAPLAERHADVVRDELRVKELAFEPVEAELRVKPNLPALGPRLGKELGPVRQALQAGEFEQLGDGRFRVLGHELGPEEVLVERSGRDGWSVASEGGVTVALDTALDPELEREGRMLDLVRLLNSMRKDSGLDLTDRIRVTLPESARELLQFEEQIKAEVLAVEIRVDGVETPLIEKV
jgi:isoleucyl-tRNA synthetase